MGTCVICNIAYDPCWDEYGNELLDPFTGICYKCKKKIENGEIVLEDSDENALKNERN